MPSLKFTGKGANRAIIDPLTGQKVFVSSRAKRSNHGPKNALLDAIL